MRGVSWVCEEGSNKRRTKLLSAQIPPYIEHSSMAKPRPSSSLGGRSLNLPPSCLVWFEGEQEREAFAYVCFSRLRRWRGRRSGHRITRGDHYELMKMSACVWQWTVRSTTKDGIQRWQAIAWQRSSHGKCRHLSVNIHTASHCWSRIFRVDTKSKETTESE